MAKVNSAKLAAVTQQAAGQHIGDVVWWSLDNLLPITLDAFKMMVDSAGLDRTYVPSRTEERDLRAVGKRVVAAGYLWRPAPDPKGTGRTTFAIVKESVSEDGVRLAYEQKATVSINADGSTEVESGTGEAMLANAVAHHYLHLHAHMTAQEVRVLILRTIEGRAAVTLRNDGGVYWVPTCPETVKLQTLVQLVGGQMHVLPIHGSPDAMAELGTVARLSLEAELASLKAEVEEFKSEGARKSTLDARLVKFEDIRSRAELYRSILSMEASNIQASIALLSDEVRALLNPPTPVVQEEAVAP